MLVNLVRVALGIGILEPASAVLPLPHPHQGWAKKIVTSCCFSVDFTAKVTTIILCNNNALMLVNLVRVALGIGIFEPVSAVLPLPHREPRKLWQVVTFLLTLVTTELLWRGLHQASYKQVQGYINLRINKSAGLGRITQQTLQFQPFNTCLHSHSAIGIGILENSR
jgi:hypothetical protein